VEVLNLKKEAEEKVIRETIAVLKNGGLVIYPTETCYGIAADATNSGAVEKLLTYKGDRRGKPISVAVTNRAMASRYVIINATATNLYQKFLPGPLTVVSASLGKVVPALESVGHTLGIRIPNQPLVRKLIRRFGQPITATSANTSGKKPPYSLAELQKYTTVKRLGLISLFLDAGRLPLQPPSTVVDTTLNEPVILRQGEITIPDLPGQNFVSNSEQETKNIAIKILSQYRHLLVSQSLIFALQGELGAGKTRFVKGLAEGLDIIANINSPTFVLIKEYPFGAGMLYHLDTWRMANGEELAALGLTKMLQPGNILAIEWLQKVRPILERISPSKAPVIWITIEALSPTRRKIKYQI